MRADEFHHLAAVAGAALDAVDQLRRILGVQKLDQAAIELLTLPPADWNQRIHRGGRFI